MKDVLSNQLKFQEVEKNFYIYSQLFKAMTSLFKIAVFKEDEEIKLVVVPEELGVKTSKKFKINNKEQDYYRKILSNKLYCSIQTISGNDIEQEILKAQLTPKALRFLAEYSI